MTKEKLIEALKQVANRTYPPLVGLYDQEDQHITADRLLLQYINDPDVSAAFEDVPKWYS